MIPQAAGADGDEGPALVVALLEERDMAAVDAAIDAFSLTAGPAGREELSRYVPLWRGMRALLEGRFGECERQNAFATGAAAAADPREHAAHAPTAMVACTVQLFGLRLAQDRLVELEPMARSLADQPGGGDGGVALACLRGLLGRDGEARAELRRLAADGFAAVGDGAPWLATVVVLAELAATLDQAPESDALYGMLLPHSRRFAVEAGAAVCHGSVSRHLGLLAHTLGRWDDADAHFRQALADNAAAGAPLLVAHTSRQWSALLRARDAGDGWERGLQLLVRAEAIYRRLGVDRLADEARQVLARSHEPPASERRGADNAFHHEGDTWLLSYGGVEVRLDDNLGLHDLAALLGNPGRSFHVTDLAAGAFARGIGHAGQPVTPAGSLGEAVDIDARARAENQARLAELDRELAGDGGGGDPVEVALARAERDVVVAGLAATASADGGPERPPERGSNGPVLVHDLAAPDDPVERARWTVSTRIRLSLDRIDVAHPTLGRHLRHSVRTGTFCSYEPEMPTTWPVSRPGA
ncbi:MAG: hypothetical protein H0T70_08100 [Acidimicrobiia bacterium]|nr:hypothetical protein [Acidimicrobiia bacterium]